MKVVELPPQQIEWPNHQRIITLYKKRIKLELFT